MQKLLCISWLSSLMLFTSLFSFAQKEDFVLLNSYQVQKKITRRLNVALMQQNMYNENASELWIAYLDANVGYRITSHWSTELHTRQIRFKNLDNTIQWRQLYYHTISYSNNIGKWYFNFRNRTQSLIYGEHFDDRYKGPKWYLRNRFAIKYKINYYWAPYTSIETFKPLNGTNQTSLDQVRYTLGFFRTFNENFSVESYYQIQRPYNRSNATTRYVLGLNAYISF